MSCNCGCGGCQTKIRGPLLTENKIKTDSPLFYPSEYLITSRNTQGGIVPLALRISKTK
jgi:hypothetical protein